jgi:molecular chaperone Hsp33
MADRIVRAFIKSANLLMVSCVATDAAREARRRHGLASSSGLLLGEGLTAGLMLASLQKGDDTRINVQLECDGPARGFFIDADTAGRVRGYVKNKAVRFPPAPRFVAAPLLGKTGYVSVLRDVEGEFYRGSVGIETADLSRALETYFANSEQTDTTIQIEALASGGEELGWVGGLLVQRLPDGDEAALERIRRKLHQDALFTAVRGGAVTAHAVAEAILGADDLDLLADYEVQYACRCSRERVLRALSTLTNVDIMEMISEDGKASANCDFCGATYEITEAELREVLDSIDHRDAERGKASSGTLRH